MIKYSTKTFSGNMFRMEQRSAAIRTLLVDLQVHGVIEESSSCWAVKSFTMGGSATHRPFPWDLRHTHSWGQGILLTKASAGGNHLGMISQAALTMWSSKMLPPTFSLSFRPSRPDLHIA